MHVNKVSRVRTIDLAAKDLGEDVENDAARRALTSATVASPCGLRQTVTALPKDKRNWFALRSCPNNLRESCTILCSCADFVIPCIAAKDQFLPLLREAPGIGKTTY
jgi:hypothetical protein